MENKDKENDKMSEEVITNDATKDGANATTNKDEVVKANSGAVAQANKDVITRNLAVLGEYRTFAESLINTDLGARFKENVTKDGTVTEVINIDNMVTCLLTGQELGLSPMTSLAYGRNLNLDAIQKVELGKTLGLSVTASLKIYSVLKVVVLDKFIRELMLLKVVLINIILILRLTKTLFPYMNILMFS